MALVMSGLPTARFVFEGFLPRSGGERSERIAQLVDEQRTVVLYEAPHRLERTLADLELACGSLRRVALARELTKMHEEMWRGTLHDAHKHAHTEEPRGEYVLVLEGAKPPAPPTDDELNQALRDELNSGASKKDAAARVAAKYGAPKRKVYELALMIK
jgi:16S rRNA (cytidine1402-2'-O)-methyltransferase